MSATHLLRWPTCARFSIIPRCLPGIITPWNTPLASRKKCNDFLTVIFHLLCTACFSHLLALHLFPVWVPHAPWYWYQNISTRSKILIKKFSPLPHWQLSSKKILSSNCNFSFSLFSLKEKKITNSVFIVCNLAPYFGILNFLLLVIYLKLRCKESHFNILLWWLHHQYGSANKKTNTQTKLP